jgi:hypothetical protein
LHVFSLKFLLGIWCRRIDVGFSRLGIGINITEIIQNCTQQWCTGLMAIHVIAGCDYVSAFKRRGKTMPLKRLQRAPKFLEDLVKLGDAYSIDESCNLMDGMEEFVCRIMYGDTRIKKFNEFRLLKLKRACGGEATTLKTSSSVDFVNLPPCRRSLVQHVHRTNYTLAQWKRSHIPSPQLPPPGPANGWCTNPDHGKLQPFW